jgi:dynein heavy chain
VLQDTLGKSNAAAADKSGLGKNQVKSYPKYTCPVYKYPQRTDIHWIFNVDLPAEEGDAYWRLRGVSLLGTID